MSRQLFDTDGIRGKVNIYPITPEMALRIGKAVAKVFKNKGKTRILIGKDTRISGYILENALTAGICSMGGDALLVGPMPTPAIAHLTKSLGADVSIVISASHNPADDNGIKIFSSTGFKLPDKKELELEKVILSKEIDEEHADSKDIGKAYRFEDAKGRYIEFAKSTIDLIDLKGLKIVVDCANGATYYVGPTILKELGAEVIILNNEPNGLNINLKCGSTYLECIKEAVKKHKADIGISYDGDGDRVLMCDEKGNEIDGDQIMAMIAIYAKEINELKNNTVVATVMSNKGFEIAMKKNDIKVIRTKVGDRYVIEEMVKHNYNIGGEQSGHIIFLNHNTTGDGIISSLHVLKLMKIKNKKLSELASCMEKLPQILINIEVKEKKELNMMSSVSKKIKEIEVKLGDEGRVLVRYSGTQNKCRIMIEGKNIKEIEKMANEIVNEIKKEVGI